jgi:hypothetical protein
VVSQFKAGNHPALGLLGGTAGEAPKLSSEDLDSCVESCLVVFIVNRRVPAFMQTSFQSIQWSTEHSSSLYKLMKS